VDFLLVLIELFSLGVTTEVLRANIDWKSAILLRQGQFGQNFRWKGSPAPTILLVRKLGWMWAQVPFVLSQCTRLTDGQTDRQKGLGNTVHCITCSHAVKNQC